MIDETVAGFQISPTQKRLWALSRESASRYGSRCILRVEGPLDANRLQHAFFLLQERHEILRTTFKVIPGSTLAVQNVHEVSDAPCVVKEVSSPFSEAVLFPATATAACPSGASGPFQSLEACLWTEDREKQKHWLEVSVPAMCGDAPSLKRILMDISDLCTRSESSDTETIQYADAGGWFNEIFESEEGKPGRDYWKRECPDFPVNATLPGAAEGGEFLPQTVGCRLDEQWTSQLRIVGEQLGQPISSLMLAIWAGLIRRCTSSDRITIGYVSDGRALEELRDAVGPYSHVVPITCEVPESISLAELAVAMDLKLGSALQWQDLFAWPQSGSQEDVPYIPFHFDLQEAWPELTLGAAVCKLHGLEHYSDRFDIALQCAQENGTMSIRMAFDSSRYAPAMVENLLDRYLVFLKSTPANIDSAIGDLDLLSPRDLTTLTPFRLVPYQLPAASPRELFEMQADRIPQAPAVYFKDEVLTFSVLEDRANRLANYLIQRLHVGPETTVALFLDRSFEMVTAILAVMKTGGAYVPVDPQYPPRRIELILQNSRPSVVLTTTALASGKDFAGIHVVDLEAERDPIASFAPTRPCVEVHPETLAYVIYTSGSTGVPKGVMVTNGGLLNYLIWSKDYLRGESGVSIVHSSLSFDLTVTALLTPLMGGQPIELTSDDGADCLASCVRKNKALSLLKITPAHLEVLAAQLTPEDFRGKIGTLVVGGEALRTSTTSFWKTHSPSTRIVNEYGPTETVVGCCVYEVDQGQNATVPIGQPISRTGLYVLNGNLRPVPPGVVGELFIAGAGLSRGYWQSPELTAERFLPDPLSGVPGGRLYRSGDLARISSCGELECLGRRDRQVKIRGYRIELEELESTLIQHPEVAQAVAMVDDQTAGKRLVAFVVLREDAASDGRGLAAWLAQRCPHYMLPGVIRRVDEFPLTANGKIDRARLLAQAADGDPSSYVAPSTPSEEALAQIWMELFGLDRVSVRADFFKLGGHSLTAAKLVSRVQARLGLELSLRAVFASPILSELAKALALAPPTATQSISRVPRDQDLPLSFPQQALWVHAQLFPEHHFYNSRGAVRLRGSLDPAILEAAINEVIARQESLRTSIRDAGGRPVQIIAPALRFRLTVNNMDSVDEAKHDQSVRELSRQQCQTPFDLSSAPLFRMDLIRFSPRHHVLLVTMHHIITDYWSFQILAREIVTIYNDLFSGKPSSLRALPVQYADYAAWQRRHLAGETMDRLLGYWRKQLAGHIRLRLPVDTAGRRIQSHKGAVVERRLRRAVLSPLETMAEQAGVTQFGLFLAAFQMFLGHCCGQEDVIVGTDVANRNGIETENIIGFFVNQVALRTDLGNNPTFSDVLARVRETLAGAYAHQELPFSSLIADLNPERSLSDEPIFQAHFSYRPQGMPALALIGLEASFLDLETETSRLHLSLLLDHLGPELKATWRYSTDLFEQSTVDLLADQFFSFLELLSAAPQTRFLDLPPFQHKGSGSGSGQKEENMSQTFNPGRRKEIDFQETDLVIEHMLDDSPGFPLVIESGLAGVDLLEWAEDCKDSITEKLHEFGALLFRGFTPTSPQVFEAFARTLCPELFAEYGDLPREPAGENIYGSTPYPPDQSILFHNESSHLRRWPLKQWFYCVQPASERGETPILDCRAALREIDPEIVECFRRKGLRYVRNFHPSLDVSWQDFFHTSDKAVVAERCRQAGLDLEWTDADVLRVCRNCPAIVRHPRTSEMLFFNQIQLHHVACMAPAVRNSLLALFPEKDLPRNVYYGDGSRIEDEVMDHIGKVYGRIARQFTWLHGDILMVDNMLIAHGRNPYTGPRKILVAMGELVDSAALYVSAQAQTA